MSPWQWFVFVSPAFKSSFKILFLGPSLRETLQAISFTKVVPDGLKWIECEHGIGGKNSLWTIFPSRILCRMSLRKIKSHVLQANSSQHWEWDHHGHLGIQTELPNSSFSMFALWFMVASRWNSTQTLLMLIRLLKLQSWCWDHEDKVYKATQHWGKRAKPHKKRVWILNLLLVELSFPRPKWPTRKPQWLYKL